MDKLDKTKENIRVEDIDDKTRKKLFDRFVDSGGKVLSERQKRRSLVVDREQQVKNRKKLNSHHRKMKNARIKQEKSRALEAKDSAGPIEKLTFEPTPFENFFNRLRIKLHLRMKNVAPFNCLYFMPKFFEQFIHHYKPSLIEIQMMHLDLFMQHPTSGKRIIQRLDNIKPVHYELLEMSSNLFDKMSIDQITEHYITFPDVPKLISELRDPLFELYRKLYILKPYENTIIQSFEKALELQSELEKEIKKSTSASKKKRINRALNVVFHKLYPRLHWLFCHFQGYPFPYDDLEIEEMLHILPVEKPGNRVRILTNPETELYYDEEEENKTQEDEETHILPEPVKNGLAMMYALELEKIRDEYDPRGIFRRSEINDRLLTTYLLFMEFDKEYSTIFTSNQIKFHVHFGEQGKEDYRKNLQELYDHMHNCHDSLKKYTDAYITYQKTRKERPMGNNQYVAYAKRMETIQKKKEHAGRTARIVIKEYMDEVVKSLNTLINDMEGVQKYLANPQDVLIFNPQIEGFKKLNEKKIYQAIRIAHEFASAFSFRLGDEGDISGSAELKVEDFKIEKEASEPEDDIKKKNLPSPDEQEEKENEEADSKSILKELDDLL